MVLFTGNNLGDWQQARIWEIVQYWTVLAVAQCVGRNGLIII